MSIFQQTTSLAFEEGFPSGQRDQTVNLTAPPSVVRIHPPPPFWRDWTGAAGSLDAAGILYIEARKTIKATGLLKAAVCIFRFE